MKKLLLLALLVFTGFMGNAQVRFINLSPAQFNTALEEEAGEKLIDVRQDWEFAKGHLKAAENVDFMSDDFEKTMDTVSRNTPIYVYCFSGGRSAEASEKLKQMGFKKVVNMTGGISAWEKAMLPIVK